MSIFAFWDVIIYYSVNIPAIKNVCPELNYGRILIIITIYLFIQSGVHDYQLTSWVYPVINHPVCHQVTWLEIVIYDEFEKFLSLFRVLCTDFELLPVSDLILAVIQ